MESNLKMMCLSLLFEDSAAFYFLERFSPYTLIWFCFTHSVLESLKTMGNLLNSEIAKAKLDHPGGWMRRRKRKDP